jgi:multiple sugar transport system substrate-binding protein
MSARIRLRGMTWSHPRGHDPLVACSARWLERTGVAIDWDKRSLQDFESFPVEELARQYDLIIIDHPHIGQVVRENCLLPVDRAEYADELRWLARRSVGRSFESYRMDGRIWALPVDAATQVQAYAGEAMDNACTDWTQAMTLARQGRVLLPLRTPHALMTFFTLAAHAGTPCCADGQRCISPGDAKPVWERMVELHAHLPQACLEMDPIAAFEEMAAEGSRFDCAPLAYGYVNYALAGFRPRRLAFADIPVEAGREPAGSTIGGTGLAVSARSTHPREALAFAFWVSSGPVQAGLYAGSGGQPGHADAWEDDTVNAAAGDFYRATRRTLEGAWVRPRHDGYMAFQDAGGSLLCRGLSERWGTDAVCAGLDRLYRDSLRS